ncbi:MAG: MotA/TolQ/ExbB proton channel family protein [Lachnospiraceae bacterium]|nr:MotA/TolQ/ExbB proton channel family protein [Lachnospiraceae bacterium]
MYARRFISVATAALAIAICVFITYISRDVDTMSLVINFSFLAVMLLAIGVSFFSCLQRLARISKSLALTAEQIRTSDGDSDLILREDLFHNAFLDKCYAEYCDLVSKNPDGSCDISDFINEDVIETHVHRSLLELIPDILASLGILGTFIGLVLGLRNFDPSGYEQMADSVSPLIDGIKVAFVTSIYGLALSLPFSFNLRSELSEMSNNLELFTDTFYLYVRPSHEVDAASRLLEQKKSQEDLTNDLTKIFVEQMSKSFEQSITPAFSQMTNAIYQIVDSFTASQEETVTRICQNVIRETRADLDASLSQVAQSARQLQRAQESYTDYLDRSLDRLEQSWGSLQGQVEKTMSSYTDFTDSSITGIRQTSAQIQKQLTQAQDDYLAFLNASMKKQQQMLADLQSRSETTGTLNKQMLDSLAHAQEESLRISEEQKATYQEYIRFMYQSIEKFSEVWETYSERIQAYSEEIAQMGPVQSSSDIRRELDALSEKLDAVLQMRGEAAVSAIDESFMKELTDRLTHLEELAAQPVLFRRKSKG